MLTIALDLDSHIVFYTMISIVLYLERLRIDCMHPIQFKNILEISNPSVDPQFCPFSTCFKVHYQYFIVISW